MSITRKNHKHINKLALLVQKETKELRAQNVALDEENYTHNMWMLLMEYEGLIRHLEDTHGINFNKTLSIDGATRYEKRLRRRLMECTLTYDAARGDFEGLVLRAFRRTTGDFYKRFKGIEDKFDSLNKPAKNNEGDTYEAYSHLSNNDSTEDAAINNIETSTIFKRFATDDFRKHVLIGLSQGLSVSDLAREMSECETNSKEWETTRKRINRFLLKIRQSKVEGMVV